MLGLRDKSNVQTELPDLNGNQYETRMTSSLALLSCERSTRECWPVRIWYVSGRAQRDATNRCAGDGKWAGQTVCLAEVSVKEQDILISLDMVNSFGKC
jgi:hypothetical protein